MANQKNNNEEKEFPGYPHYPAREDIMNSHENNRVDVDVENLSRSNISTPPAPDKSVKSPLPGQDMIELADVDADEIDANTPTDADLTPDDLIALGAEEASYGTGAGADELDIPGAEDDDSNEEIGEEDEENNYYSLGGDAHENLEEDKG
ncbi:MAG: hypothetical protein ABJA57_12265 [Ginsengibacter sp.]